MSKVESDNNFLESFAGYSDRKLRKTQKPNKSPDATHHMNMDHVRLNPSVVVTVTNRDIPQINLLRYISDSATYKRHYSHMLGRRLIRNCSIGFNYEIDALSSIAVAIPHLTPLHILHSHRVRKKTKKVFGKEFVLSLGRMVNDIDISANLCTQFRDSPLSQTHAGTR